MLRKLQRLANRAHDEDENGFTLIELLIVVVIIGILAAIAIPQFSSTKESAYDATAKSDLRNLTTAAETYFANNSSYPTENGAAGADAANFTFQPSDNVAWTISENSDGDGYEAAAWHNQSTNCFEIGVNVSGTPNTIQQGNGSQSGVPTSGTC